MKGTEALIFFYSIFWAAMIAASSRYQPFDTASALEGVRFAKRRFYVSVVILNIFPIFGFIILYKFIVPANEGLCAIISAAIGSLSVFGFIRILHAFIASEEFYEIYYTVEEVKQVRNRGIFSQTQKYKYHLIPGVIYILVFYVISIVVTNIPIK